MVRRRHETGPRDGAGGLGDLARQVAHGQEDVRIPGKLHEEARTNRLALSRAGPALSGETEGAALLLLIRTR